MYTTFDYYWIDSNIAIYPRHREVFMPIVLPILSPKGWVLVEEQPLIVADQIFAHFFCSDYSQTQIYLGEVSSFAWILQSNKGDILATKQSLSTALITYFNRYFDNAEVDILELPPYLTGKATISLYLEFTSKGITYNLSKAINLVNGVVKDIININNYGV